MDTEPTLSRMEEHIAYAGFGHLVGEGGMSPGRIPYREKTGWLDERGYDRTADRGCRDFFLRCFSALDNERQSYMSDKMESDRASRPTPKGGRKR